MSVFLAATSVFSGGGLQGRDARRWVRFCDVGVFGRGVCFQSGVVYKVGMRGFG